MNISKETIKYYGIPAAIALVIILIIILAPVKKTTQVQVTTPTQTPPSIVLPTKIYQSPTPGPSPTLIPPQPFTGVEDNQEIPQPLYERGAQKTTLRRQTPLTLPFGTVEFDYENDMFTVALSDPSRRQDFEQWRLQNYSSIPSEQFAIQ